ncbi:cold shock protein [Owenweeksia hongkongensis DSM 17368]|uniref:Cold shock protein n=1 Tax=Owenweeksia hongkongensis (strain DSM 17368 / CIP 108786 / JCM 12287 / NRRL B-23963 / UST20020801) TaxID=926562 RepID=G8QZJ4_OWEHD|nr:cold shock domain-containing protein [Owenweeksia hongkongensis]AEV33647.1 cold shock protein [Owenweeksia hongkongensis DSM 17368]
MAKSQETYNKKEKEKKRLKKRQEKEKKREERKAAPKRSAEEMFSYVDEHGQLTDTPPDPSKKIVIEAEDIEIGVPKRPEGEEVITTRFGRVDFFNDSKGYGFIKEKDTNEKFFVHINGTVEEINEGDKVSFELEKGPKGMNAVDVKKASF